MRDMKMGYRSQFEAELKKAALNTSELYSTPVKVVIPKVEKGIVLFNTLEFKGLVCKCGNARQQDFTKFLSQTTKKTIKGHWEKGTKEYIMCNGCKKLSEYTPDINIYLMSITGNSRPLKAKKNTPFQEATKKQKITKRSQHKTEKQNKKFNRK